MFDRVINTLCFWSGVDFLECKETAFYFMYVLIYYVLILFYVCFYAFAASVNPNV